MAAETNQPPIDVGVDDLAADLAADLAVAWDETDGLACAYVAGELDGEELSGWEARLAEGEIEACEAVVRWVETAQWVGAATSVPSQSVVTGERESRKPDSRAEGWKLVVTSAVCLLLVLGLSIRNIEQVAGDPLRAGAAEQDAVDGLLLSAWAGGTESEADLLRVATGSEAELAESELEVPEWMIAAMALPEDPKR
jgi:hypothetical protein